MPDDIFDLGFDDPISCFEALETGTLPMIEFRGHDGRALALAYSRLLSVDHRPTSGISLEFPSHHVVLRGRNLRPLYDAILQHRVRFVQESDLDFVPETAPFVDRIVIGPVQPDID